PPVAMASGGMLVGAALLALLGGVGALPMRVNLGSVDFAGARVSWLVPVIGLSLIAAAIGYVAGISAARRLGAKVATFVGLTEVLFAVLFAWLSLGQVPTMLQVVGGVFILGGVALVRADEIDPDAALASAQAT